MTLTEAEDAMRAAVGESVAYQCEVMYAMADVWDEHEDATRCGACNGVGRRWQAVAVRDGGHRWLPCPECHGTGWESNGMSLRAEALRLLAECGKVGIDREGYFYPGTRHSTAKNTVPHEWYERAGIDCHWQCIPNRLALMDAYAAAEAETRERWAKKTRELVPGATVECDNCEGVGGFGNYDSGPPDELCPDCHGTGRVPARTEGVTTT